jgi:hypothetical protein
MSQGLVIYIVFAADVLLICWFGTQLTQHVSKSGFLYTLTLYVYNAKDIHCSLSKESVAVYSTACVVKFYSKSENRF